MRASKNSASSRRFKTEARPSLLPLLLCAAVLSIAAAAAVLFVQSQNHALFYGDAAAHLNIARRIVDGRNPGYEQIGTVWLPLPHLLFLPFVRIDEWWRNGLAGAIPSATAWVIAGTFLFALLRRIYGVAAAVTGTGVFVVNPNLAYLAATPMTETIFFASAIGMLLFSVRSVDRESTGDAALAGICGLAATMTRYEGWFLLPFVALYLLLRGGSTRWVGTGLFCVISGLGPAYWLAHNRFFFADPLEFFHGPDSAKAIYQRFLDKGMARYPGDGDWRMSAWQFAYATKALNGWPLLIAGVAGIVPAILARHLWPLLFLSLSPVFYIMSLHSGGTPIFIPDLWPHSYYNTRYALAALPLLAVLSAALASRLPRFSWLIVPLTLSAFLVQPVLTWRESEVNSESRRAWTKEVADLLRAEYRTGQGILMPFGDLTAVLAEAGIPIRECIHQGDSVEYERMFARPDLFLSAEWVVAISGETVGNAMARAQAQKLPFRRVKLISLPHAPVIEVWRRNPPPQP